MGLSAGQKACFTATACQRRVWCPPVHLSSGCWELFHGGEHPGHEANHWALSSAKG